MHQKVVKSGTHSLAVTIPAEFVHSLGVKAGDNVIVEPHMETGTVHLKFRGAVQLRLLSPKKRS